MTFLFFVFLCYAEYELQNSFSLSINFRQDSFLELLFILLAASYAILSKFNHLIFINVLYFKLYLMCSQWCVKRIRQTTGYSLFQLHDNEQNILYTYQNFHDFEACMASEKNTPFLTKPLVLFFIGERN